MTEFQQLAGEYTSEIKIKGSRFIAHASDASDRDAAESFVDAVSKRFFDATHNCFAYRVGLEESLVTRFNDDGEPSGTAGRPILQTIESFHLTNTVIVVTRYFGGTKLGTGGLVRAYSEAADQVLQNSKIQVVQITDTVQLCFPYELSNAVQTVLRLYPIVEQNSEYDVKVKTCIKIRRDLTERFLSDMIDKTAGKAIVEVV